MQLGATDASCRAARHVGQACNLCDGRCAAMRAPGSSAKKGRPCNGSAALRGGSRGASGQNGGLCSALPTGISYTGNCGSSAPTGTLPCGSSALSALPCR